MKNKIKIMKTIDVVLNTEKQDFSRYVLYINQTRAVSLGLRGVWGGVGVYVHMMMKTLTPLAPPPGVFSQPAWVYRLCIITDNHWSSDFIHQD